MICGLAVLGINPVFKNTRDHFIVAWLLTVVCRGLTVVQRESWRWIHFFCNESRELPAHVVARQAHELFSHRPR